MPLPKFSFIPEHQLEFPVEREYHKASILAKGILSLGTRYIEENKLDGKYVQFYQLKTATEVGVGWRIIDENTSLEILNKCKKIKKTAGGGSLISVSKILRSIGKEGKLYKKVDIRRYAPLSGENVGKEYSYIILNGDIKDGLL